MPKKIHYVLVKTPEDLWLTPRRESFQFKRPFGPVLGRYEYHDSTFEIMQGVLHRICRSAGAHVLEHSVRRLPSFTHVGSSMKGVIITGVLVNNPRPGYFIPVEHHQYGALLRNQVEPNILSA